MAARTSSALHSQLTGQMWRYLAMKESVISPRAKKAAAFFRMSGSGRKQTTSSLKIAISARSARNCPLPGKAAAGVRSFPASSGRTRSPSHQGPRPALPSTPRSVTGPTASILNSRLNFRPIISTLLFMGQDLIFVSMKPAAAQRFRSASHS